MKDGKAFLLYSDDGEFKSDVYVTQNDIFALKQSKAYVSAAVDLLMQHVGISFKDVDSILIGAAFGYDIDPAVFIQIGLIPRQQKAKVSFMGNTARTGAEMALLSSEVLKEAEKIAKEITSYNPRENVNYESTLKKASVFSAVYTLSS